MTYMLAGFAGLIAAATIVAVLEIRDAALSRLAKESRERAKSLAKAVEEAEDRGYRKAMRSCRGAFVSDLLAMIAEQRETDLSIVIHPHDRHAAFQFRRTVRTPDRFVLRGEDYRVGAPALDYDIERGETKTLGYQFHVSHEMLRLMEEPYGSQQVNHEVQLAFASIDREVKKMARQREKGEP